MSNADKYVALGAVLVGLTVALYVYAYLPQAQAKAFAQERLDLEGGVDLQPTNQRVEDPLGKNLGVSNGSQ